MSKFSEFFKVKFPTIQATIDQTQSEESILLKKACRIVWDARQKEVDQLNDRLNAMEQCYIAMKKERDDLLTKANTVVNNYKQLRAKVDTSTPQVIIDAERRGAPCL